MPKSQLSWLNLLRSPVTLPPSVTAKHRVVNDCGGKDFEKNKVLRRYLKMPRELSTTDPGSKPDDGEELDDDDVPD